MYMTLEKRHGRRELFPAVGPEWRGGGGGGANEEKRAIIAVGTGAGITGEACGVTLSSSSTSSFSLSFHPTPIYRRLAAESRSATAATVVFSAADTVYRYYYHYY